MEITPERLLSKIAKILEELKIPYAITGGFAVIVWGKPRFTADIDIIIEMTNKNIVPLVKLLCAIDKDVYVSEEVIKDALGNQGEFNFIHPQTGLKVDFWVKTKDVFEKLKIKRAIPCKIENQVICFVSPEDLILSKLIWFKESESHKHLEDIKTVLNNSKLKLNFEYLKDWAEKQSTIKILEGILSEK